MTVLNLIATLVWSVAMRFSTVIATLLVFTIFFTSIKFQKSNSNAVAEHKNMQTHFVLWCNTTLQRKKKNESQGNV